LATTARILSDVVQGTDLKDALETEGKTGVRNLLQRAEKKLASVAQTGSSRRGSRKKRAINSGVVILPPANSNSLVGGLVPGKAITRRKRQRADAFGPY